MKLKQAMVIVTLAGAAGGLTGCGAQSGPSGAVPQATSSSAAATAASSPQAGPASSAPATASSASEAPEEAVITIKDFQYELPASVAPGATVTVINEDTAPHTVTADNDGGFDAVAAGGETVTFTAPEEPGEYPIICTYHPQMSATLVVQ
jgi:plastocyanin